MLLRLWNIPLLRLPLALPLPAPVMRLGQAAPARLPQVFLLHRPRQKAGPPPPAEARSKKPACIVLDSGPEETIDLTAVEVSTSSTAATTAVTPGPANDAKDVAPVQASAPQTSSKTAEPSTSLPSSTTTTATFPTLDAPASTDDSLPPTAVTMTPLPTSEPSLTQAALPNRQADEAAPAPSPSDGPGSPMQPQTGKLAPARSKTKTKPRISKRAQHPSPATPDVHEPDFVPDPATRPRKRSVWHEILTQMLRQKTFTVEACGPFAYDSAMVSSCGFTSLG